MRRRPPAGRIARLALALAAAAAIALPAAPADAFCWWNCSYTKTKHPIVLAHGFLGFDSALGILDYFYGIESSLENEGATVYVTEVSPVASSAQRGEQLIAQLDQIRAITGKPTQRFNLVGHSQGGLDIRYVAGVRPDLVASVTTIATPHLGSDFVAIFGGGGSFPQWLTDFLGGTVSLLYTLIGNGNPVDFQSALQAFDPAALAAFNADPAFAGGMPASYCGQGEAVTQTLAGPRRNYSWTGRGTVTNWFDVLDPLFALTALLYDEPSDGFVEVCSAHFGQVIRDSYHMNHLDEVNQVLGLVALFETNPKTTFRAHANRLKNAGL